jgi:Uma2 family endonuclease
MNIALRRAMTVPEYLAWADVQDDDLRTELINGQIVTMSPERVKHIKAKFAATLALTTAIERAGVPCEALADGATVRIDDHTAYGPDALVYCGEELSGDSQVVPNPVVVVEVRSPTTAHMDTSAKLIGYFKLPSVYHYLIIDPDTRTVTHHLRASDGSISASTVTAGPIRLDPPGIAIEAADLIG